MSDGYYLCSLRHFNRGFYNCCPKARFYGVKVSVDLFCHCVKENVVSYFIRLFFTVKRSLQVHFKTPSSQGAGGYYLPWSDRDVLLVWMDFSLIVELQKEISCISL